FRGATTLAVLRQVSDEQPVPIRSLNPDVPAWLEALVLRLMAKDPARRFQSAAEVASLLEGYLAHLRQPATVPAPSLPSAAIGGEKGLATARTWGPALVWLAAGLVLLSVLGLSRWLMQAITPPEGQASQREFYQDFRGSKGPHPVMQWSGR